MSYDDWKTETSEDEHCRLYHHRTPFPAERCVHGNLIGNDCCIEECDECADEIRLEDECEEAQQRFETGRSQP